MGQINYEDYGSDDDYYDFDDNDDDDNGDEDDNNDEDYDNNDGFSNNNNKSQESNNLSSISVRRSVLQLLSTFSGYGISRPACTEAGPQSFIAQCSECCMQGREGTIPERVGQLF